MPHLILEFSENVIEKDSVKILLKNCNQLLTKLLPTNIAGCKSRAVEHHNYWIAEGEKENAFVHINLRVLKGRTEDTLQNLGSELIKLLENHFSKSLQSLNLQITIEISEFQNYFKITSQNK
jgi:5-carboxymethyl-2-hydroxymuconate isomerase